MSTKDNEIAVQPRSEFGNNAARRARKAGLVPGVIYGKGQEAKAIYLNAGEWASIARHNHHILYLLDGDNKQPALVKEVQINHLKNYFLHVDFQAVDPDQVIHSTIAIHPFGECAGVSQGGVLEQIVHEIPVACKSIALIDELKVNVTKLGVGEAIHVRDLQLPEGITVQGDADAVVFHVVVEREEPAAAAPAAADAAAAPAAEATK